MTGKSRKWQKAGGGGVQDKNKKAHGITNQHKTAHSITNKHRKAHGMTNKHRKAHGSQSPLANRGDTDNVSKCTLHSKTNKHPNKEQIK